MIPLFTWINFFSKLTNQYSITQHHQLKSCYMSLKSLTTPLFVQPFIQAHIKGNIKDHVTDLCEGNPPVTGGFPYKVPVTWKMCQNPNIIMTICSIITWDSIQLGNCIGGTQIIFWIHWWHHLSHPCKEPQCVWALMMVSINQIYNWLLTR